MHTRADRALAWADMLLADHGILRLAYRNRHQVTPQLWRSAQPAPGDIFRAKALGIRTVVSLRAPYTGGDHLERAACDAAGLTFERLVLSSGRAPFRERLEEAIARFPTFEPPVLLHCKSGADRAGLATALYRMIVDGAPAAEAKTALSWRYGHIAKSRTGVLDAFIDAYATTGEAEGLPFDTWVRTVYDPDALDAAFRASRAANALTRIMGRE